MLELGCLRGDRCGLFAALQRRMEQVGEVPVRQQFEVGPQGPGSLIGERHAGGASGQDSGDVGAGEAVPQQNDDGHTAKTSPNHLG